MIRIGKRIIANLLFDKGLKSRVFEGVSTFNSNKAI
jgi:hypothetical protein